MTLKQLVIRVNDYILYIGFALICITSVLMGATAGPLYAAGLGLIALVVFCLLSGFWFAISSIADNSQRQVSLQEKQLKAIEKLNRSLEAHLNNQFPDV